MDGEEVKLRFSFASAGQAIAPVPETEEDAGEAGGCAVCRTRVCLLQRVRFEVPAAAPAPPTPTSRCGLTSRPTAAPAGERGGHTDVRLNVESKRERTTGFVAYAYRRVPR